MTMHTYQTYNFRFQLLRQKIVSAYNIATSGDSRMKKVAGHCGAKENVGGNINVYLA